MAFIAQSSAVFYRNLETLPDSGEHSSDASPPRGVPRHAVSLRRAALAGGLLVAALVCLLPAQHASVARLRMQRAVLGISAQVAPREVPAPAAIEMAQKYGVQKGEEERLAAEAAQKFEEERLAKEVAQKEEEKRLAAEVAQKLEEERLAKEAAACKEEEERLAREAAQKLEEERLAAKAACKEEEKRLAIEAAQTHKEQEAKDEKEPEPEKEAKEE